MTELVAAHTFHARKGAIENAFRYSVDYVLVDPDGSAGPGLFGRNRAGLMSVQDADHGGAPGRGRGAAWARHVLAAHGVRFAGPLLLLAQPRLLGHVFNPVSFWLACDGEGLRAVIAEVTNTFGDRHSYLCAKEDGSLIGASDRLRAVKVFHVSPFQPIAGAYTFRFDIQPDRVGVWIDLDHDGGGVIATLVGSRKPLTNRAILWSALRRPFGTRRVLALIYWQAMTLKLKSARYRPRPLPLGPEVTKAGDLGMGKASAEHRRDTA
ncbi:DUF1365 domain-containing protein [Sagittula salina]|uniref:DUF1365 domain-containing protein n=1 Tax=Sagittula salina TaxID=2820268 RepID=A0A940MM51_9RHOB|nr:DUF1365 domain-containing protein [Sagittula salina]MBP0484390.1 DUF1365 domain-containing protein [Sagittula salina]